MINFIKSFYSSHRFSGSAGKILLWIWVKKDLPKIKGELGVDLAGGSMLTKRFFSTKKYICVDIDQAELDKGKKIYPEAITINSRIQEFLKDTKQINPDVLVCFQTMGTNPKFEHNHINRQYEETLEVVRSMYYFLKPGGSMIFNICDTKNIGEIKKKLSLFFDQKFNSVRYKFYGAFHITKSQKRIPMFIRFMTAYLMHLIPSFRTLFGLKKERVYFFCQKKL